VRYHATEHGDGVEPDRQVHDLERERRRGDPRDDQNEIDREGSPRDDSDRRPNRGDRTA